MAIYEIGNGAYLVSENGSNVLIDGASSALSEEYISSIEKYVSVSEVDAVICNYAFPDNVESIEALIEVNENITVYASPAGLRNIEEILNKDFNHGICKNNGRIEIGSLKFIFSLIPGTPWPDKMMTYFENENVLFVGDFFTHGYLENNLRYCKDYTLSALDTAENLKPNIIYSRGRKIDGIDKIAEEYKNFFKSEKPSGNVIIAYSSAFGYTYELALRAASIAKEYDIPVQLINIDENPVEAAKVVNNGDALLIGVHTEGRSVLKKTWRFMSELDVSAVSGKRYLVFGSTGWSGEGIKIADSILSDLRMRRFRRPFEITFKPTDDDFNTFEKIVSDIFTGKETE